MTDKGTHLLKELDRAPLASIFEGGRLKKFYPGQEQGLDHQHNLDHKIFPNLEDLLALESDNALSELDNFSDS